MLASRWDEDAGLVRYETPYGVFHDARASLAYAGVLLRDGGAKEIARAERVVEIVANMQETRERDAHAGNFRWFFEDEGVTDLNAVEFVLDGLNALVREHEGALSAAAKESIHRMIERGLRAIDRLDVHPSYTNIALSDICNSVLGGETLGDAAFVERGRRRLEEWFAFTDRSGAPHEFNSPTYAAVDIARMAFLAGHTRDTDVALMARVAEERLWLHSALHYHPALAQIAGPHSRSYRDGWTGAPGYLKLILWRLLGDDRLRRPTPYFPQGREEGHSGIGLETYHCPPHVMGWLREKRFPFDALETADAAAGLDLTTYMTGSYALGSASRSYAVGDPPEPWPQWNSLLLHFARDADPGYGVLFCRYIVNDKDAGAVVHESMRDAQDLWEEGRHVAAQHRNRAIVAYGLQPRTRPARSYKLSVRVLGVTEWSEIWCGARRIDAFPARVQPRELIVIAEGAVFIAVFPLEPTDMASDAPIELNVAGGMLTLDIYNYRGPSKTFWEHRSQSGPFYKGNVRNAFIVEVADRAEYADVDAFRRHIAQAQIADSVDDAYVREIAYASEGGAIVMRYSLWDMRLLERRFDGIAYAPPMGRAGATDGKGAQWAMSCEPSITLGDVKLTAAGAKSLVADRDNGLYVCVRTAFDPVSLRLETRRTTVECAAFRFGRLELDERAGTLAIETLGAPAELHVRTTPALSVTVNGASAP